MRLAPLLLAVSFVAGPKIDSLLITPTPTPTKTPTRLEKLRATPTPAKVAKPEICAAIDTLVAASNDDFKSVRTNEQKGILGKTWESSITPKGTIGRCSILAGAAGTFVAACHMTEQTSKAAAEEAYTVLLATVKTCFPDDQGATNDDDETGERTTDFGLDRSGVQGAVQVGTVADLLAPEKFQVELRFHQR